MDHHYDRRIIFSTDREYKNLYPWSLKELDAEGGQLGRDWIPWSWTLYFKAKDISLRETWSTQDRYPVDPSKGKSEAKERKFIRAELYPDAQVRWPPSYSMLGTDRNVSKFFLHIEQIPDDEDERCTAYGVVSYTTEIDFRDVTDDDSLWIYFHFHAATFARYAQRITSAEVDSLTVRVGSVAGFYSDWSPSSTTDNIRILTADSEHKVEGVPEDVTLHRLGEVGEAELYFARETKLRLFNPEPDEADEADKVDNANLVLADWPADQTVPMEIDREKLARETLKLIQNIRIATWVVVALLVALLIR